MRRPSSKGVPARKPKRRAARLAVGPARVPDDVPLEADQPGDQVIADVHACLERGLEPSHHHILGVEVGEIRLLRHGRLLAGPPEVRFEKPE